MEKLIESSSGKERARRYGIDVMRAFAMFLVIMGHVVGRGGLVDATSGKAEHYIALFTFVFSLCSINIFGLISGYVGYGRKLRLLSLLKLWLRIIFWTIIISAIFVLTNHATMDLSLIKMTLLPIISQTYWYMTGYFVVAILSPILNIIVEKMDIRLLMLLTIISTVGLTLIITTSGNNPIWLLLLYVYGAIIKKGMYFENKPVRIGVIGYSLSVLMTFIASILYFDGTVRFNKHIWGVFGGRENGLWPASLTMLIAAMFILLIGINLKINDKAKGKIRIITPLILSVYLIHVHPLIFERISDSMIWLAHYAWWIELPVILIVTIIIYGICLFLDFWREKLFGMIFK